MIRVENLNVNFGQFQAVNNLSFEVKRGDSFALLGANGSGKTTTIRSILNLNDIYQGKCLINGRRFSVKNSSILGYLPEERGLYVNGKVIDVMVYILGLKGMKKSDAKQSSLEYLARVGLSDKKETTIKKLSGGQQQKIQFGVTTIHEPELLILDEPTKGLDPINRQLLEELLLEMQNKGSTIIFITHQMDEVERFANNLLILKSGAKALSGNLAEIKKKYYQGGWKVETDQPISKLLNTDFKISSNGKLSYTIRSKEMISQDEILKFLKINRVDFLKLEKDIPSLEDIFVDIYQDKVGLFGKNK